MMVLLKKTMIVVFVLSQAIPALGCATGSRGGFGSREAVDHVMQQLDIIPGSVIIDMGAGDGWWARHLAKHVGASGTVHAGEIVQKKVDAMAQKHRDVPQLKPYLCPLDGTGRPENSCDMVFLSKTYHHLEGHGDYLRHVAKVTRPAGRLAVIERHPDLASGQGKEHAWMPGQLVRTAEEAGWMLLTYEMIPNSDHYLSIFVKPTHLIETLP